MKRIVDFFRKIWHKYKVWKADKYTKRIIAMSKELFQLSELNHELWITYNGAYVCPASMLNGDTIEALYKMRNLYIIRKDA